MEMDDEVHLPTVRAHIASGTAGIDIRPHMIQQVAVEWWFKRV